MWVYYSKEIPDSELKIILEKFFEGKSIYIGKSIPGTEWADIVCTKEEDISEFPYGISIWTLGDQAYSTCISLAKYISICAFCETICDGSLHEKSPGIYGVIVFKEGRAFIASNLGTLFGDGTGGKIKVIEEIEV